MFEMIRTAVALLLLLSPLSVRAQGDIAGTGDGSAVGRAEARVSSGQVLTGASLMGQPWRLEEFMGASLPAGQEAPYLLFTEIGDLLGFGGCNYFVGKYRLDEVGNLLVSSLRATHRRCPEAPELEANLLASLLLANSVGEDAAGLVFFMNGKTLMRLGKAPELSVEELQQQGKLLKIKKKRAHKARGKKKNVIDKSKKSGGKAVQSVKVAAGKSGDLTRPQSKR